MDQVTGNEFVLILQKFLRQSELMLSPDRPKGKILTKRLDNSDTEDVVISVLFLNFNQIQEGLVNVNVYTRNLHLKIGDNWDDSQPDTERLFKIEKLIARSFKDFDNAPGFAHGYSVTLQQIIQFEDGIFTGLNARIEVTAPTP